MTVNAVAKPFASFRPTPAAPPPVPTADRITDDFESVVRPVPVSPAQSVEIPVYRTRKRWRALDVYVQFPAGALISTGAGYFSVWVYAITGGIRTVVASGQNTAGSTLSNGQPQFQWMAAARVEAEAFEVTVACPNLSISAPTLPPPNVAIIASDQAVSLPSPDYVGAVFLGSEATVAGADADAVINTAATRIFARIMTASNSGEAVGPGFELLGLHAVNNVAAARYIQLFDCVATPVNGNIPMASFPIMAVDTAGCGFTFGPAELAAFKWRRFTRGIWVAKSTTSTALTLATATDCGIGAWIR